MGNRVYRQGLGLVLVFGLFCIPGLLGASPALAAPQAVKIGNIIPLSGPSASVGQQGQNARDMATEEINAAGGIKALGGAKLQMIYADSESKPEKGVAEAERLINTEKVHVLTGCWNSAVTYPTTAVAERYGIPFVVPVSVADQGTTVLLVEQDVRHSLSLSDRGYVLEHGRMAMEGPAADLLVNPHIRTAYLGL